ncbi:MAG: PorT family protein [Bacteroidales bacterium]|nr:PorT family protein [Bacteroidales bacterium]
MKNWFLIASLLMCSVGAFAQQEVGALTIQPKVGLNIANYKGTEGSDPRLGLAAGVELEYQLTNRFSVSAGALYSMQGSKDSRMDGGEKIDMTIKTDYINVPVLVNFYVVKGLAVKACIQPAFNVKSDFVYTYDGKNVGGKLSEVGIDIKSFDLAVPMGLSYEYKNVVVDGRYNLGLMNIVDYEKDDTKNSVFQITVGYKFKL